MRLTSLSPTDRFGFSDGFRSTLDPFKPALEPHRNDIPGTFDDSGRALETADRDEAERENLTV
jgi:hypothetical protein